MIWHRTLRYRSWGNLLNILQLVSFFLFSNVPKRRGTLTMIPASYNKEHQRLLNTTWLFKMRMKNDAIILIFFSFAFLNIEKSFLHIEDLLLVKKKRFRGCLLAFQNGRKCSKITFIFILAYSCISSTMRRHFPSSLLKTSSGATYGCQCEIFLVGNS